MAPNTRGTMVVKEDRKDSGGGGGGTASPTTAASLFSATLSSHCRPGGGVGGIKLKRPTINRDATYATASESTTSHSGSSSSSVASENSGRESPIPVSSSSSSTKKESGRSLLLEPEAPVKPEFGLKEDEGRTNKKVEEQTNTNGTGSGRPSSSLKTGGAQEEAEQFSSPASFAQIAQKEFGLKGNLSPPKKNKGNGDEDEEEDCDSDPNNDSESCWKEYLNVRRSLEKKKKKFHQQLMEIASDVEEDNAEDEKERCAKAWESLFWLLKLDKSIPPSWKNSIYFDIIKYHKSKSRTIIEIKTTLFSTTAGDSPHAVVIKTLVIKSPQGGIAHCISYAFQDFTTSTYIQEYHTLAEFRYNPNHNKEGGSPKLELDDSNFTSTIIDEMIQFLTPTTAIEGIQNKGVKVDPYEKLKFAKFLLTASLYHGTSSSSTGSEEEDSDPQMMIMRYDQNTIYNNIVTTQLSWVEHRLAIVTGTERPYHQYFHFKNQDENQNKEINDSFGSYGCFCTIDEFY